MELLFHIDDNVIKIMEHISREDLEAVTDELLEELEPMNILNELVKRHILVAEDEHRIRSETKRKQRVIATLEILKQRHMHDSWLQKLALVLEDHPCYKYLGERLLEKINYFRKKVEDLKALQCAFLVKTQNVNSYEKHSFSKTTNGSTYSFKTDINIRLRDFFINEYNIHSVKLYADASGVELKISSLEVLEKLLEENKSGSFGIKFARLIHCAVNGGTVLDIKLEFADYELATVRQTYSTHAGIGKPAESTSCSSLASSKDDLSEDQVREATFQYLDMLDRLIENMDISDMEKLCDDFKLDQNSLDRIQRSSNKKRVFVNVCRQQNIWNSNNMTRLTTAVEANNFTRLKNIIDDFNDMSLLPKVNVKIKPKTAGDTFRYLKDRIFSRKRHLDSELNRNHKVRIENIEEGSIRLRLTVPSLDALHQLLRDIQNGQLLQTLITISRSELDRGAMMKSTDRNVSVKVAFNAHEFNEAETFFKADKFNYVVSWKQALVELRSYMEEEFDPVSLTDIFLRDEVLTKDEVNELEATKRRKDRVRLFISYMQSKEETSFHSFLLATEKCGYYGELATELHKQLQEKDSEPSTSSEVVNMSLNIPQTTKDVEIEFVVDNQRNVIPQRSKGKRLVETAVNIDSPSTSKRFKGEGKGFKETLHKISGETAGYSEIKRRRKEETYEEFLTKIGIDNITGGKMTLENFLRVRNGLSPPDYVSLFWQKLTALDYRAVLPQYVLPHDICMRDFMFCTFHFADEFLRQDIIEKLSACQLAVPLVLGGIKQKNPELLLWACRRIIKKWKGEGDAFALEQPIVTYPTYTVSMLRIGEVQISKSKILNCMLGYSQGYGSHPFFLDQETDKLKPRFAQGSVESAWFLPNKDNEGEILKTVTTFFNLRGDCREHPMQRQFACKSANFTIAIISTDRRAEYVSVIRELKKISSQILFVAVKERKHTTGSERSSLPIKKDNWIFVKHLEIDTLSKMLCEVIADSCSRLQQAENFLSIEKIAHRSKSYLNVDEDKKDCQSAQHLVKGIFESVEYKDVLEFKQKSFPLQESWREWVELDKTHFESENDDGESFELQREKISEAKMNQRKTQLEARLSDTMKLYHNTIDKEKNNHDYLQYFLGFLNDKIFQTVSDTILDGFKTILKLEDEINQKNSLNQEFSTMSAEDVKSGDTDKERAARTYESMVRERRLLLKKCRDNNLGFEHFMREIGQLYEAYIEFPNGKDQPSDISLFPSIAASLVTEMHSLELMDGDTGRVPLTWVTAVLDQLTRKLSDPKVLVISVVGVQSSGKSTLLNSMFGLRFPVRAGRCTRGLFIRFLSIEENLSKALGFSYLIVVDTEGIRSIDHDDRRFDNELVTFAFSIANVTVFNIEGENIDTDMTGILQIAAHALMRMKEVDLQCKCKIVQQRVADLTAPDRNKASTYKIKQTLDEATKIAAEAEGLEGRYQQFSDVVELKLDEDLQYIPCLWKGGMSPPNHMYSEKVIKMKNGLFRDVKNKIIRPDLTMSTFTERVRDVWKAVKEEDFIFNFQDSVRAVDFNKFCLEYNRWVVDMRNSIMLKTNSCMEEMDFAFEYGTDLDIESLKDSLSDEVESQRQVLTNKVREYIENHPRRDIIMKHNQGFRDDIAIGLKDAKNHAVMRLSEEYEIRKLKYNLPRLEKKYMPTMLINARTTASELRQDVSVEETAETLLKEQFKENWKMWIHDLTQDGRMNVKDKTNPCLKTLCEKLLLRMTRDMAVGNEIQNLISAEGGLEKHIQLPDFSKYIHVKYVKAWIRYKRRSNEITDTDRTDEEEQRHVGMEKVQTGEFVQGIIEEQVTELYKQKGKHFDTNIFQLEVRKTLMKLSSKRDGFKLPHLLIAKALLHLCAKAFQEVFQYSRKDLYEVNETFSEEYYMIMDNFIDFYREANANKRAAECIFYYLRKDMDREIDNVKRSVLSKIQNANYTRKLALPWDLLKESVLSNTLLSSVDSLYHFLYADVWYQQSMQQQAEHYLQQEWIKCCKRIDDDMHEKLGVVLDNRLRIIQRADDKMSSKTNFQPWLQILQDCFEDIEPLVEKFESIYEEADLPAVSTSLKTLLKCYIADKVKEVGLYEDFHYTFSSFKTETGLSNLCSEVCPMCGSPCDNIMESHSVHSSLLHRPRGIKGEIYPDTSKLVLEDCNSSLVLKKATFKFGNATIPCSKYKEVFPNWDIRPSNQDYGKLFWHWVFANNNEWIALQFGCNPADIPQRWLHISQEEALESLDLDKNMKTKGRSTFRNATNLY